MHAAFSAQSLGTAREIYQREIEAVRKELFDRLDAQLLPQWSNGRLTGVNGRSQATDAAMLASELARLDTAFADGKITQEEHAKLTEAQKAKFTSAQVSPVQAANTK